MRHVTATLISHRRLGTDGVTKLSKRFMERFIVKTYRENGNPPLIYQILLHDCNSIYFPIITGHFYQLIFPLRQFLSRCLTLTVKLLILIFTIHAKKLILSYY